MKYIFSILSIILIASVSLSAQVGINTENPEAALHVVTKKVDDLPNAVRIKNANNDEILTLDTIGNLGINKTLPITRVDLRSTTSANRILGVGNTNQTAAEAGAGALRYAAVDSLQFSDGVVWITLGISPPKLSIVANNSSGVSLNSGSTILSGWTLINAENNESNSFNPSTGYFTAPRDGIYSISITGACEFTAVTRGSIELNIANRTTLEFYKTSVTFLSNKSYPNGEKGRATLLNKGYLSLKAGEQVAIGIYQTNATDATLVTDGSLNILNIIEM